MTTQTLNLELNKPELTDLISSTTHFNNNWDKLETVFGKINDIEDWALFSIAWTASTTNPVLGNGTLSGRSIRVGSLAIVKFILIPGSTTTFGAGTYFFSGFPYAGFASLNDIGVILSFDSSAALLDVGTSRFVTSTTIDMSSDTGALVSPTVPFTWATGDQLMGELYYQVDPLAA